MGFEKGFHGVFQWMSIDFDDFGGINGYGAGLAMKAINTRQYWSQQMETNIMVQETHILMFIISPNGLSWVCNNTYQGQFLITCEQA